MPQIIPTTDEIAVREQRDIVFLSFSDTSEPTSAEDEPWERIPERQKIIRWLNANNIAWEMCIHCPPGAQISSYKGAIYLNVAPDVQCKRYELLLEFLEDEQGNCCFPGVNFLLLPLPLAQSSYERRERLSE